MDIPLRNSLRVHNLSKYKENSPPLDLYPTLDDVMRRLSLVQSSSTTRRVNII